VHYENCRCGAHAALRENGARENARTVYKARGETA
jgi:hypothetical protein